MEASHYSSSLSSLRMTHDLAHSHFSSTPAELPRSGPATCGARYSIGPSAVFTRAGRSVPVAPLSPASPLVVASAQDIADFRLQGLLDDLPHREVEQPFEAVSFLQLLDQVTDLLARPLAARYSRRQGDVSSRGRKIRLVCFDSREVASPLYFQQSPDVTPVESSVDTEQPVSARGRGPADSGAVALVGRRAHERALRCVRQCPCSTSRCSC